MKQNSQWLSQVRTRSNTADWTSTPNGSPARLGTDNDDSIPPRTTSSSMSAASVAYCHSITSRGRRPSTRAISSPGCRPARSPADPGATATTRGEDIAVTRYLAGPAARPDGYSVVSHAMYPAGRRTPAPLTGTATMNVDRVLLAEPRGFCAGVEMAIKALAWMVRAFDPPVYCYHEIVHNKVVVQRFEAQGVVFVDDIGEVPPGRPIMLSAHGSAPDVVEAARARGSFVVDSVCPLVTKVHHEVKVRAGKGYRIIYVGHEGHEEAVGTMAVAPDSIDRVQSVAEVEALGDIDQPVALLAQTTLSHRDWEGVAVAVKQRFPDVWT